MAITLPDARELSDDILDALRIRALYACEQGYTEAHVADLLGLRRETISRWWTAYTQGGLDALPGHRTGRPQGSGRMLDDEQAQQVQELLRTHQPQELGIASPLWTRRAVQQLIVNHCQVHLAIRTVGLYLQRWNFTPKRPSRQARKQDPDEVREWLEVTYPAIEARADKEDAEIHWCDEVGASADHHPASGYSPVGEPTTMDVPGAHIRVNQITTITNTGQVHFMNYTESMTAALFIVFLGKLLQGTTGKIFLIVDRLRAHTTPEVDAWVAEHRDRLELFYLPRYTPERNVVEYLNQDLKSNVNVEGLPDDKGELRAGLETFMQKLLNIPSHVISYFFHPKMQYAASEIG